MRIALICDGISPYVIGGMQKHSYYLAKYFAKNRINVDLFHFNQSDLDISRLECFSDEEKKYIHSIIFDFPKAGRLPGHYLRESYEYSELIFEKIKNNLDAYDFIYTKGFCGWKLIQEKKKGLRCAPIGVKFHGYEMFQKAPDLKVKLEHYMLRGPVRWISQNADYVFSYGGKITGIIKDQVKVANERIIEIPTGIEKEWLRSASAEDHHPRRFVFLGRYERRKGIEELNTVLKELADNNDFIFEFIGPISKDKQIASSQLIYHGEIRDASKIREILKNSDVLVCPSHSEGMPNVILEGMASGLAIIATDVGAVNRQVSDKNGVLIAPGNVEALKKAIVKLKGTSSNEMTKLKEGSLKLVNDSFLWDNIIRLTIDKIKGIIS
jgi:glycosyltransferase involved in cell wall biosynthesis